MSKLALTKMANQYHDKCGPLLSPRYRQYIDQRTGYTESGFATPVDSSPPDINRPRQAKSEIKHRSISAQLEAFTDDMQRFEKFHTDILQDREGFRHIIYRNKLIIDFLYHEIERWKHLADYESERMDEIEQSWKRRRKQLQAILTPLYNGLQDSKNAEQEYYERLDALKEVCDRELTDLLKYIIDSSEQEQINQPELKQERDGYSWQQQATKYLEKEHNLVESEWWGAKNRKMFNPTEKGKAVFEALESLLESAYLDDWQDENESREKAAFKALSEPHNIDI